VPDTNGRYSSDLRLKSGISLTQARFALSNFCLSNFGADGQYLADVIEFCSDVNQLQTVLQTIREEVRRRCPERLQTLVSCVREANDDGETSFSTAAAASLATQPVAEAPKRAVSAPQSARAAEQGALQLAAGVSLVQARFMLSEFCLDQFGARGQQLVDAVDRCTDAAAVQRVLSVIAAEIRGRHRNSFPKLIDCVREINATGD
jgi:hypothetical protein